MSAFYSETLRKDQPHGAVFHGSGEIAEQDRPCKWFQNGLYYNADGKLLKEHPYNIDRMRKLDALEVKPDEVPDDPTRTGNPETLAKLNEMDDATVKQTAINLKGHLASEGSSDDFEPGDDRLANEDFILKYV